MSDGSRLRLALLATLLVVAALALWPKVEARWAPVPERAFIAIEVEGTGIAETGRQDIEAGETFALHAVLEATTRDGESIYFTEAPSLRVDGEIIPAERIRAWKGKRAKVLWFTVEVLLRCPFFYVLID